MSPLPDPPASAGGPAVVVRELDRIDDLEAAAALFAATWSGQPPATASLLKALVHAGGYVSGAYATGPTGPTDPTGSTGAGELMGAAAAFLAEHDGPALHSHLAAVAPAARGLGVGAALKLHQRQWAAARGLRAITWTFDPLIRRNAWFNLTKLGAAVEAYLPDFYGPMDDGINRGDASDRLLVVWAVTPPATVAPEPEAVGAGPTAGDAVPVAPVLDVVAGRPVRRRPPDGATRVAVATPPDAEALRAHDPALARAWRGELREVLAPLVEDGTVAGFTRAGSYLVDLRRV